jgi:monoterpene epsilon-lactone hydrolase
MADLEIIALREKLTSRPRSDDYRQRRRDIDERGLAYGLKPDVNAEPVTANGVRAEWSSTPGVTDDAALLYLHGGVYVIGSLDSHRHLVAEAGRVPVAGLWLWIIVSHPNIPFLPRSRMPSLDMDICWVVV